jgi:hypothetical protein
MLAQKLNIVGAVTDSKEGIVSRWSVSKTGCVTN